MNTTSSPKMVEPPAGFEVTPESQTPTTNPEPPAQEAEATAVPHTPSSPLGEGQVLFRPTPGQTIPAPVELAPATTGFAAKAKAWARKFGREANATEESVTVTEVTEESVVTATSPRVRPWLLWAMGVACVALAAALLYAGMEVSAMRSEVAATKAEAAAQIEDARRAQRSAYRAADAERAQPWWKRLNKWW